MTAAALAVFGASLAGSLHCAGMCGPLVLLWAGEGEDPRAARFGHVAYNAGRLVAYAAMGAVAGAIGAAVEVTGAVAGFSGTAALLGGAFVALWGLHGVLGALGARVPRLAPPARWAGAAARAMRAVRGMPVPARAGLLGLLSALLPCGFLWAFVATAAGTGSPASGAAVMALFWSGTLPALVAVGAAARRIAGPLRRRLPLVTAAVVLVVGLAVVAKRAWPVHADPGSATTSGCCDHAH
ncbi:MAG TPA: sulfite exporter TauE/SafE family protein [Candidatus Polarisedimenticolaceae bacterium]